MNSSTILSLKVERKETKGVNQNSIKKVQSEIQYSLIVYMICTKNYKNYRNYLEVKKLF